MRLSYHGNLMRWTHLPNCRNRLNKWKQLVPARAISKLVEQVEELVVQYIRSTATHEKLNVIPGLNGKHFQQVCDQYWCIKSRIKQMEELVAKEADQNVATLFKDEISNANGDLRNIFDMIRQQLLKAALTPDTSNQPTRGLVLEIRAGTGGAEAMIFASELLTMYRKYCHIRQWSVRENALQEADNSGIREGILEIKHSEAFKWLRWESGVHRVQRVPLTESQGRIHTSTVTVAVLPKPEEVKVELYESELRFDSFKSGGPGGQHVNKTNSAVRVTHIPTGIAVAVQEERCAQQNKARALELLRLKLWRRQYDAITDELRTARRNQIGGSERSEKFRTYNYPQDRVTDHRLGKTLHGIERFMTGSLLDEFLSVIQREYEDEALKEFLKINTKQENI